MNDSEKEKVIHRILSVLNHSEESDADNAIIAASNIGVTFADSMCSALTSIYTTFCEKERCRECPLNKLCCRYIEERSSEYNEKSPIVVDLFCGAGGLSLGFSQEGFRISFANDIDKCCIETYRFNHPEVPDEYITIGDINEILDRFDSIKRFKTTDVVVGGPPCQGFSVANRQRIIDDPRNKLYKSYVRAVSLAKPRFFVMENVKGMLSVAQQVIEDFKNIGYNVECRVLNAKDYGVPQNRERLIFIGSKTNDDISRIFTEIEQVGKNRCQHVLKDALEGLRPLKASSKKNSTELEDDSSGRLIDRALNISNDYIDLINQGRECPVVYNHKARYNNSRDVEIYSRLEQGDRSDDPKIADIMPYKSRNHIFKDKYYKLEEDKPCKTITAHMKFDCNMYIHPTQARGLTPREAARVQSYPDDYVFLGAYTKTYMQIGNSVPPLLGRAIAEVIKKHLGGF